MNEIAFFVEVAKTLNFSRASANLGLPQSSLSRHIRELEKTLGLQLFNRTTRRIELTEAGRFYFERVRPLVEEAEQIQEELQGKFKQPQGKLRVSLPVDLAYEWIAPLLPAFAQQFPQIQLEMDLTPRKVDLISEPFDLVIRAGEQPDSAYIATLLKRVPRYLYASKAYLHQRGEPQQLADLAQHSILGFCAEPHWQLWDQAGSTERLSPQPNYSANSPGMLQRLAEQGLGIALLPTLILGTGSSLQRILPAWQGAPAPIYALTATRLLPTKSRCFIDFLKSQTE